MNNGMHIPGIQNTNINNENCINLELGDSKEYIIIGNSNHE